MSRKVVWFVCLLAGGLVNAASAATWTNAEPSDDSWCTPGNWEPPGPPGPADTAVISTPARGPVVDCYADVNNINGPMWGVSTSQVMDIVGGMVGVRREWNWSTGTGTATININGISDIIVNRGWWRAPNRGTGVINITGDPAIYINGEWRGADGSGSWFEVNIGSGYVWTQSLKFGDDGNGRLNMTGGIIDITGDLKATCRPLDSNVAINISAGSIYANNLLLPWAEVGSTAQGTASLKMLGGFLSVANEFKAPGQITGKSNIYLHGGLIECGSFTHAGAAYSMDITEGILTISGDVTAEINNDIAAGHITAYGGEGTVNVELSAGNTVVTASAPDPNIASNPSPPDGGTVYGLQATFAWSAGINALKHDVYLGADFDDVNNAHDPNILPGRGRCDANSYQAAGLEPDKTYYWRIDEVNAPRIWKGKIWSFTTVQTYTNSLGMLFVRIPPGTFTMGQGDGHRIQDSGTLDYDEQPEHTVKISKPFYILATRVADEHYQQSGLPGSASDVSWDDANNFAAWLGGLEGKTYRLPTEAEWEYVCNNHSMVQDMNSRQWVQDWHGLYGHNALLDPAGPANGIVKVIRADGQNRRSLPTNARYEPWQLPEAGPCGFRLVLEDEPPQKRDVPAGPFCQAAVKQNTAVALQGPDANIPYFTVRFALPIPPDNTTDGIASLLGCDPTVTHHNHSPGFEVMPNGDALAVWFTGGSEVGPEVRFVQARLRYGSDQWDMPELFYDMKNMSTTSGLLWTESDGAVRFFGGGRIDGKERRPFVMAVSDDSGAAWTLKRPYFPIPAVDFEAQPVVNAWRQDSNTLYTVTDGGGADSVVWRSADNGVTWYDMGGRTNGRHSTILPIGDSGTLLSYGGKSSNIDGWMPYCKSYDWGATWPESGPAPFAVLGGNQRPCMTRLANGKLVFICDCQRKGDNYQPPGWTHGYGCLIAISANDGVTWYFKKFPVTLPHESDRQYGTLGYSTVRQAPNGVIHVLTTMTHPCLHYELNEAWIYSEQGDIPPETTGGTVNQYNEYYPGGALKTTWSARTCPNGRYLLHGTETSYYPDGKKEHQVTYANGRKTGDETFWQPDGIKMWSWRHDDVNNISVWRHYWSNGFIRIESRWNSYPAARDLPSRHFSGFVADGPAYHWFSSGRPAKAYNFSNGSYLGEIPLCAQARPGIDLETFVHHWLWVGLAGGDGYNQADLNKDGIVNFVDFAAFAAQSGGKGRVIEFGWDMPTIPWLHDNVTAAEATPFHGIVVDLARREGQPSVCSRVWIPYTIPSEVQQSAQEDITLLNDTDFTRLRENSFFRINSSGYWPPPDWFDSDFNTVVSNTAFAAAAVNQTAFAGIVFDPEDYHFNPWYYPGLKYYPTKTFEQYQAQVRQRGRETASVIRAACPTRDFTLLFLFANSLPYLAMQYYGQQLSETTYGLLPAFIDGLLDEAGDQIRLIDGMESAYPNKTLGDFYSSISNYQGGASLSADPYRYLANVGIGFGTWMDYNSTNLGWYTDPNQFGLNFFTPQAFHQAMDISADLGEFSWVYTQVPNWYLATVPQDYFDALASVTGLPAPY
ncbi:MAG TPA: SUMF1/EgtB/PvdO family nonheme iron enzyme [Sedimentisphaerales bacterium]|nr:SUMF1/EgtB/PvdO family nonheme iron enzyme [Sedimentisphaerales bacterium]